MIVSCLYQQRLLETATMLDEEIAWQHAEIEQAKNILSILIRRKEVNKRAIAKLQQRQRERMNAP